MTQRTPTFSVIVPTYHRNDLLAKCLAALAPAIQTLPADQYEVIVSDDGREETAEALVRDCFPFAKWVVGPRRGPAANRNYAASQASAPWLVFTDDDCVPNSGWLAAYAAAIDGAHKVYEGKTTCVGGVRSPLYGAPINEHGGCLWSCNMMVHREVFAELGGFEETFPHPASEDVDFRERLKDAGYVFPFVAEAVVDHPPRPVATPNRQIQLEESIFYLNARRNTVHPRSTLMRNKLRSGLKYILRSPKSWDSVKALGYVFWDMSLTWRHYPRWEAKYLTKKPPPGEGSR